ncbi:Glu-tRNA(Gln) amidotransferase GatDE subunit E [Candidatus Pacearchaeota archaeon ex4484_71]|nr:MAG: Glu-tRNA(Gln) amidotransferase GatDE subunit E [Candidatus Pacearchaeota archaeon ex4484_71]
MELDYKKLQFMSGLEIHQQLEGGGKKLFCNCRSILRSDEPDYEIKRKLHVVAGESGEVDVAVSHEAKEGRTFVYRGNYDTSCLVELDEEPPREINKSALKTAVQIALLMNMEIVPLSQIMRKTVVDGSNTSGFQRTVLIARDGYIETSKGRVTIQWLYLEEDAARIVLREEGKTVYNLDRLGIPLVEVVTAPEIKDANHAKEVALKLGEILRSCDVRRGIGTIRQDVNISIRGENRVEIKGMQDMDVFVDAIEKEVLRQKELSDSGTPVGMEVRNVLKDASSKFMRPLPGSARMYPETDLPLLKISRGFINKAKRDLPKLISEIKGDLKKEGLSEEMINLLLKQNKLKEFKELKSIYDNPQIIAKILLIYPSQISSNLKKSVEDVENVVLNFYGDILRMLKKGKIKDFEVKDILSSLVLGKSLKESVSNDKKSLAEIEEWVMKTVKSKPGLNPNAYMGLVMNEFKGQVSGKEAMDIIRKFIK